VVNNDVINKLRKDIERLCDTLECEHYRQGNIIFMPCPVHGGDNKTGCTLFVGEDDFLGWKCWTHDCEEIYHRSIIGFIKGVLSYRQNKKVSTKETHDWISDFLGMKEIHMPEVSNDNHNDYIRLYSQLYHQTTECSYQNEIIQSLAGKSIKYKL